MTTTLRDKMLDRVRALLAKAEATEFPEEADAFLAKAEALMAAHSIDRAMLRATDRDYAPPLSVVWDVPAPYANRKMHLLNHIVRAFGVAAIFDDRGEVAKARLFGYQDDIDTVQVLYTALLAHSTRAMLAAEPIGNTRGFRSSFLGAYAIRIGKRLDAARSSATAEAGPSALPVLRSRDAEVNIVRQAYIDSLKEQGQRMTQRRSSARGFGVKAGTAAADQADLGQRRVKGAAGAIGSGR